MERLAGFSRFLKLDPIPDKSRGVIALAIYVSHGISHVGADTISLIVLVLHEAKAYVVCVASATMTVDCLT